MADDPPTPTYRTPAADVPETARAPEERLAGFAVPGLGDLELTLGLGAPIRLALDRQELRVTPGSGVRLTPRGAPVPPLQLQHLRLDLATADLQLGGSGLGPFEARAASIAIAGVFEQVLPWQPGRSVVDVALQNLPARRDGARRVVRRGPVSVWVHPDTRLEAVAGPEAVEVSLSHAVHLKVLGLGLGLLAVRYLWGAQRLELEGAPGQPVRNALLRFAAWVASRWLRRRLPAAMAAPGYDPFADPARRAHVLALAANITGKPAPAPSASNPAPDLSASSPAPSASNPAPDLSASSPAPSDSPAASAPPAPSDSPAASARPAPSDSPAASAPPAPSDSPAASARPAPSDSPARHHTAAAPAGGRADARPRAPEDGPASPEGIAARLRALKDLRLTADAPPAGARVLIAVPLGARGHLALCTDRGGDVLVRRRAARVALEAPAGLYVHADQLPGLADLRLRRVGVDVHDFALELDTTPALGGFLRAAARHLAATLAPARLPPAVLYQLRILADHDELLRKRLGSAAELVLTTPHDQEVVLRHGADMLELKIPGGLELEFQGLQFLPPARLTAVRYVWKTGDLQIDATPELGDFGGRFVSHLFQRRFAGLLPPQLGMRAPVVPPVDPAIADARPAVAFHMDIPALGPLDVRLDPNDRVRVALSVGALELRSDVGVAVLAPELDLAVVFSHLRFELPTRGLAGDAPLGAYFTEILTRLLEQQALPRLQQRLPAWKVGADAGVAWQIVKIPAGPLGHLSVQLPVGAALVVERSADALELRADPAALEVVPENRRLALPIGFERLRWRPAADEWTLDLAPPVGPLVTDLLKRLVHRFAPAALLAKIAAMLALPAPRRIPLAPALPPAQPGVPVFETEVKQLGAVKIAADPERTLDVALTPRGVRLSFGTGATARLPGLGFTAQLDHIDVALKPLGAHIEIRPDAGPLFDELLAHLLRGFAAGHVDQLWPADQDRRIGQDTLLILGKRAAWGPLRICVPEGGDIALHLDRAGLALRAPKGLFVSGPAIDWLPDFYLHTLGYRFEDGAVTLEISGIVENHYHEPHPVSPITQALAGHLLRVIALPKAPAWTRHLGVRKFPLPAVPKLGAGQILLYRLTLPGDYGEVMISMAPDDAVTVKADEREISIVSDRGLLATLPGLRFQLQLRGVRYHLQSGEIQVGGLGQLENAMLEAVVARELRKVPPVAAETPGDMSAALGALLDQLPVDDKGRRILFSHRLVNILLLPNARLVLRFTADGLVFTADPPVKIDGPARIDYDFGGVRYLFSEGAFHLNLDDDGGVVAGMLTDVVIRQAEKQLNQRFKPLLPEAMRAPGYSLATDPHAEPHIAELIRNFASLGKKNKAGG